MSRDARVLLLIARVSLAYSAVINIPSAAVSMSGILFGHFVPSEHRRENHVSGPRLATVGKRFGDGDRT